MHELDKFIKIYNNDDELLDTWLDNNEKRLKLNLKINQDEVDTKELSKREKQDIYGLSCN